MSGPDRKLVLVVDDTPTNVAVVSGVLKDLFRTKVATNGEKALAIANAMVDVERDRDAGVSSVALILGPRRSWWVHLVLHAAVGAIASASLLARGVPHAVVLVGVAGPAVVVGAGVALAGARAADHRERGWELEAVGIALLAVGWLLLAARA